MRILLVSYDNDNRIAYFPLGLGYIASALRGAGYEVEIYQQDIYHFQPSHLTKYLDCNHFDAVGLGACGGYYQYRMMKANALAVNLSKDRPMLWLGGHLPSPDPAYFLKKMNADFVVIGEGEISTVNLLNTYHDKGDFSRVKGIAFYNGEGKFIQTDRESLISDVDNIPWPAYDLFDMEQYVLYPLPNMMRKERSMAMLSGRGCPFKCNFCYRMDEGFRPRSPESVIEEIQFLIKNYYISYIVFWDDLLMSSIPRVYDFCEKLIRSNLNIHWYCNGRLNYACKDIDMLRLMKRAGCVFINYGIESLDNECLKRMHKSLNTDMIIKGIENTEEAGISPGLNIIFGNLGETRAVLEKDVDFLLKYDDQAQVRTIRPVTPYPGTELYEIALERGLIKDIEDFYENKHTNSDLLTCNFTEMTDDEFYDALYWANSKLLDHYLECMHKKNSLTLTKLYKERDSEFRGFRMV